MVYLFVHWAFANEGFGHENVNVHCVSPAQIQLVVPLRSYIGTQQSTRSNIANSAVIADLVVIEPIDRPPLLNELLNVCSRFHL
jgi:hypothetical protein